MFSLIFRSICRSTVFAFSTQALQEYIKLLLLQWSTKSHRPNVTSTESARFIKISLEQMLLSASFVQFLPPNFCISNMLLILELKNSISTQEKKIILLIKYIPSILLSFLAGPKPVLPEQIRKLQHWLNTFGNQHFTHTQDADLKHKM